MSERNYYVICDDNCKFESMTKEQIIAAIADATGVVPEGIDVDAAFVTKIKEMNANKKIKWWFGKTAEFNAIQTKEADTVYILTDDDTAESLDAEIQDLKETVANFTETFSQDLQTVLPLSGGTMTGDIDMGLRRIKNLDYLTDEQLRDVEYNKDAVNAGTMMGYAYNTAYKAVREWTGGWKKQFVEIFKPVDVQTGTAYVLPASGYPGYEDAYIVELPYPIDINNISIIKFNTISHGASYDGAGSVNSISYIIYAVMSSGDFPIAQFYQTALHGSLNVQTFSAVESVVEKIANNRVHITDTQYGLCPKNDAEWEFNAKYEVTTIESNINIYGLFDKIKLVPFNRQLETKTFGVSVEIEYMQYDVQQFAAVL